MSIKNRVQYIISIISLLLPFSGCSEKYHELRVQKASGDTITLMVEMASTSRQKQLGLMYRKTLAPDRGMLFVFGHESIKTFTMKNTFIPLDMIFISRDKTIAGIVENTAPLTKGPYDIDKLSLYVLETNAFFCKKNGIAAGDSVEF